MKIRLPYSLSRSTATSSSDSPTVRGKKIEKAQLRQQNLSSSAHSEGNNIEDDREQTSKESTRYTVPSTRPTLPSKKSTYLARKFGQKHTPKTKVSAKSTSPLMKAIRTGMLSSEDDWEHTDSTRSNRSTLASIKESDVTKNFGNDNWEHFSTMKDSTSSNRSISVAMQDSTRSNRSISIRSNRSISLRSNRSTTSLSTFTASEIHNSEYEHWKVHSDRDGGCQDGCRAGCTDGQETVSAFGDAVTEVFDLINEVAFPEILDAVTEPEEVQTHLSCGSSSYNDDDDSIFNRSEDYHKSRQAKEFLGFIGAVKPSIKKIITPMAPSALLKPDVNPLSLAFKDPSPVQVISPPFALISTIPLSIEPNGIIVSELKAKEKEHEVQVQAHEQAHEQAEEQAQEQAEVQVQAEAEAEAETEAGTRYGDGNKDGKEDDNSIAERPIVEQPIVAGSTMENSKIIRSCWRGNNMRKKTPDRYRSLDDSFNSSSDEWENVDDSTTIDVDDNDNDDWSNADSKTTAEEDLKNYVEGAENNKEGERQTGNPTVPYAVNGARLISSAIAYGFQHSFNRDKPNHFKVRPVCGTEPPELVTIVETSKEDATTSEEEGNQKKEKKVKVAIVADRDYETKKVDLDETKRVDVVGDVEFIEDVEEKVDQAGEAGHPDKEVDYSDESKHKNTDEEAKDGKLDGRKEEDYYSSAVSGSEVSSYDDRTFTSYTGSEDESFTEFEEKSVTSHTNLYSVGLQDSSSGDADGSSFEFTGYSNDTFDNAAVIRKMSVAESLLQDSSSSEEEPEENDLQPSPFTGITTSRFCSVYDNLYPADSIFSFTTQEESSKNIFDIGDSTALAREVQEIPPSILTEEESSLEPPASMLTKESSVDDDESSVDEEESSAEEDDVEEVESGDDEIDVPQEVHTDEIQDKSKRKFLERSMMLADEQVLVYNQKSLPEGGPKEQGNQVEDDEANIGEHVNAKDNQEGADIISVDLKNYGMEEKNCEEKEVGEECKAGGEDDHGEDEEYDAEHDDEEKNVDDDEDDNVNSDDDGDGEEGKQTENEDEEKSKPHSDTPKRDSLLPPRQHQGARDEPPPNASHSHSVEGQVVKIEHSNSNRSRRSNSSNESTMDTDKVDAGSAADINRLKSSARSSNNNVDRQASKRRHFSRLKMYNQHKQNLLKLQLKAE